MVDIFLAQMYSIMEECASIWYGTKDKKKAGIFSWWVNFFGVFSAEAWRHFVFSWGLRPFWDFLGWKRPAGHTQTKKTHKGKMPTVKKKFFQDSTDNTSKKFTIHEKMPDLFFSFVPSNIYSHYTLSLIKISQPTRLRRI